MQKYSEIAVSRIGAKCRSKKEDYDLLSTEGGYYLPPLVDTHYKYISQILVGDKKAMKWKDIKVYTVPQLKGLTIADLLQFARNHVQIEDYIPSYVYSKNPNRDWICNIINTACQAEFQKFIEQKISERSKHVITKKSMNFKVLQYFWKAKNISTERGSSHFLIKTAGKRKWEDVKNEDAEQLRVTAKDNKLLHEKITIMQERIDAYEKTQDELLLDRGKLVKLYDQEVIDSDGEYKYEDHE